MENSKEFWSLKSGLALVLALAMSPLALAAETRGPSVPDPVYPECLRYPVLGSKGDVLYWKFDGYCERARRATDDPNERSRHRR